MATDYVSARANSGRAQPAQFIERHFQFILASVYTVMVRICTLFSHANIRVRRSQHKSENEPTPNIRYSDNDPKVPQNAPLVNDWYMICIQNCILNTKYVLFAPRMYILKQFRIIFISYLGFGVYAHGSQPSSSSSSLRGHHHCGPTTILPGGCPTAIGAVVVYKISSWETEFYSPPLLQLLLGSPLGPLGCLQNKCQMICRVTQPARRQATTARKLKPRTPD
jgi:hypothetical protein